MKCISCNKCKKACPFLNKYDLDLKEYTDRVDLAYNCFMCGKCKSVCPMSLDGKKISIILRAEKGKVGSNLVKDYFPFKNNVKKSSKSMDIYFPGCNFAAFYPETNAKIVKLFLERGGDFSFDCCKLPIKLAGDFKRAERSLSKLEKLLISSKTKRLVTACSNCYYFFKENTDLEIISIYEWLLENNIGNKIREKILIHFPCPDRYEREIFKYIEEFLENSYYEKYQEVNCCGMGGGARAFEKEISDSMINSIKGEDLYTYCSTCSRVFMKNNNTHHILSVILGIDEKVNPNYFVNSMKFKFKNRKI